MSVTSPSLRRAGPAALVLLFASGTALAQSTPVVYPASGQSMEQQTRDESACRSDAQQKTGFNPAYGPQQVQGTGPTGQIVGGAARGAAVGAVGGAIGGNAGEGAAIGAGVGATLGLFSRARTARAQNYAQGQANQNYAVQLNQYNTYFSNCMRGRGYTVNYMG